jgi:hypothetical protein
MGAEEKRMAAARRLNKAQRAAVVACLRAHATAAIRDGIKVAYRWRRDDLLVNGTLPANTDRRLTITTGKSFPQAELAHAIDPLVLIDPIVAEIVRDLKSLATSED